MKNFSYQLSLQKFRWDKTVITLSYLQIETFFTDDETLILYKMKLRYFPLAATALKP